MLRPWWQAPWALVGGGIGAVAAVVLIIILIVNLVTPAPIKLGLLPASVVSAVTHPSASVVSTVGGGNDVGGPEPAPRRPGPHRPSDAPHRTSNGKPEIVFVGAEYCPYCAAERWPMLMALSRFGTFSGLHEMTSSATDVYPSTHTLTFYQSTYSSPYVDFMPNEVANQAGAALETPTSAVESLFTTYGEPPYQAAGNNPGYPFLDIGGRFTIYTEQYSPAILEDSGGNPLTWQQIASDLSNAQSPVTQAIVGAANYLTAAICVATGNQPSGVCSSSTIQKLESTIQSQTLNPSVAPPSSS